MSPNINKPTTKRAKKLVPHLGFNNPTPRLKAALHDLILCQAAGVLGTLHNIAIVLVGVLHVRQTEGPATVLVPCKLGCRNISIA